MKFAAVRLTNGSENFALETVRLNFSGAHIAAKANRLISESARTAGAFFYIVSSGNRLTGESCGAVKSFTTLTEISATTAPKIWKRYQVRQRICTFIIITERRKRLVNMISANSGFEKCENDICACEILTRCNITKTVIRYG